MKPNCLKNNQSKTLIFALAILLCSCGNTNFTGKWKVIEQSIGADTNHIIKEPSEDYFRFRKDRFLRSNNDTQFSDYWGSDACKYEVANNIVSIYYSLTSENIDKQFEFKFIGNDTLVLRYLKPESIKGSKIKLFKINAEP